MAQNSFVMHAQKQGRMKYLFLTIVPPIILLYLFSLLLQSGVQIGNSIRYIFLYVPLVGMAILAYYFIFKKNHRIEVKDNTIIEYDWRKNESRRIKVSQIYVYKRNWLREIILIDNNGNKLLCVESNMSNFHEFEQWLERHHIH